MIVSTHEYIIILLGLWLVIVYIVVFDFLQGFTFLFQDTHGFDQGFVGTTFAAITVGIAIFTCPSPITAHFHKHQDQRWKQNSSQSQELPSEYRLLPAFPVALAFPISLFWLAWKNFTL